MDDTRDTEKSSGADAVFHALALEADAQIGQRLFTVTRFNAAVMQVQRVYSSDPAAYPVGGRKSKRDTAWGRQVLIEGKPLVCEGDEAIARNFDDHGIIIGLGAHSSINAPVLAGTKCVGVLNFLFESERVSPRQVRTACQFALRPAVVAALAGMPGRQTDLTAAI